MEQILLFAIFVGAIYYLYRKLFKNKGCSCSNKSCCSPPPTVSLKDKKDGNNTDR
ncbi:hypothetical protein SAMN05660420_00278 [Desulfuromusa kysingii]|uniref:Virus attachment protein p12 family protein n=1 Tax=Desulfuromusa kysingii TaxID=37625 RepID=A0A1H3VVQ2_9BACT|nr:hypothetical protein [Desulfuromusa kysingii]SDZ78172.1 hypothetical protein SAMN05660420_00278 [Desulfuromusa kysingii]